MGKNKKPQLNKNSKKDQNSKNDKSCFRVDKNRALKAKKNKDFVKFNKVGRIDLVCFQF